MELASFRRDGRGRSGHLPLVGLPAKPLDLDRREAHPDRARGRLRHAVPAPAAATAPSHWRDRPARGRPKGGTVEQLAWKLRVSTLWIFLGVGMLAAVFAVMMPSSVLGEYIATGEFEGEKIDATMLAAMVMLFCLLPLAMAFLTQVLSDPINRYANAALGIVAAAMWTLDLAEHLSKEPEISGGPLFTVALIVAGLLIVWHAWKWPVPAEQARRDRRPASSPAQRAAGMVS